MADPNAALATQLRNIEAKTGRSLDQMRRLLAGSGLSKHGEKRSFLMQTLGLGYGDANTVVHLAAQADTSAATSDDDPLAAIYTGAKAPLRSLHEQLIARIDAFGAYETAPKKGYVSLRRKKQFAMLGPATKGQLELGLNVKDLPADPRLKPQAAPSMCQYKVRLASAAEIDAPLLGWLRRAFDAAG